MDYSQIEFEVIHSTTRRVLKALTILLVGAILSMSVIIAKVPEGHMKKIFALQSDSKTVTASQQLSILP